MFLSREARLGFNQLHLKYDIFSKTGVELTLLLTQMVNTLLLPNGFINIHALIRY